MQADTDTRGLLCGVLLHSYLIQGYLYANTLYFSFFFRAILILHAEKGLVMGGRLNIKLFNQIYWVVWTFFLLLYYTVYPVSQTLLGMFPQDVRKGRICLLLDIDKNDSQYQEKTEKVVLISLAFCGIMLFVVRYMTWRVNRFIRGVCPRRKMSCIGAYRRNILTFQQTSTWFQAWVFWTTMDNLIFVYVQKYETDFSKENLLWFLFIHNFVFVQVVHSMIPLILSIPSDGNENGKRIQFYVREQSLLEPRRCSSQSSRLILAKECRQEVDSDRNESPEPTPTIPNNSPEPTYHTYEHAALPYPCTFYCRHKDVDLNRKEFLEPTSIIANKSIVSNQSTEAISIVTINKTNESNSPTCNVDLPYPCTYYSRYHTHM